MGNDAKAKKIGFATTAISPLAFVFTPAPHSGGADPESEQGDLTQSNVKWTHWAGWLF